MDTIVGYFEQYVEWVKESVRCYIFFLKKVLINNNNDNKNVT